MAVYQDLLDAIARVRAGTGDADAWTRGLSGTDLAVAANLVAVRTPGGIDAVLAKIRAGHPDLFGLPPSAPAPPPSAAGPQSGTDQGAAAEAIRTAEIALAKQKSAVAQVDLQVITAVLNAHVSDVGARAALDVLQRDIEAAVTGRTDLATPAGAHGFQRYLVDKLRDIRAVVETAGLDATSKAALVAALASLYATPLADASEQPDTPSGQPAPAPAPASPDSLDTATGVADADPLDELLDPDWDPGPDARPAPVAVTPAPLIPSLPALGGGAPGPGGAPLGGGWAPTGSGEGPLPTLPAGLDPASIQDDMSDTPDDPVVADTAPKEADDAAEDDPEHRDDDAADPAGDLDNVVRLPGGETVTAGSPELAAAITAAVAGTPIAEAFAQQGITIPAPGSPVTEAVDPGRLVAGDVGILSDRHALALGNGTALLDGRIQPAGGVNGPDFLGWEHPPAPSPTTPSTKSDAPTPTRPAVTAGPS